MRDAKLQRQLQKRRSARRQMLNYLKERECLVLAERGDHRLLVDPADNFVTEQVISKGDWHRGQTEACFDLLASEGELSPGGVFVDIGANIGTQTLYALLSPHFDKAAAFEPDPDNFSILTQNIEMNAMSACARLHNVGLGDADASLSLSQNPANLGAHTLLGHAPSDGGSVEVLVKRAGDMFSEDALGGVPSLVWIDVEGFEPQVMAGLQGVLRAGVPVVMEFSPGFYGPEVTASFAKKLSEIFGRVRAAPGETRGIGSFDDLLSVDGQADIILTDLK